MSLILLNVVWAAVALLNESDTKLVFDEDNIVKGFVLKGPENYIPEIFVDHKYRAYPNGKSPTDIQESPAFFKIDT